MTDTFINDQYQQAHPFLLLTQYHFTSYYFFFQNLILSNTEKYKF